MLDCSNKNENKDFVVFPVGFIRRNTSEVTIEIIADFKSALKGLEKFSHVQILWWFSKFEDKESRETTQFHNMPFKAPRLGVFACRSPKRPNPIGLTTAKILSIDNDKGLVKISNIDAYDNSPVLDLQPYLPSCDRVRTTLVPEWAAGWPDWLPEEGLSLE
jgi:tRNA-Thr(GGU) m(6)t(6)A37 methyltransferase TsaA